MAYIQRLVPKWKLWKQMNQEKYGWGVAGFAREAWAEGSEVVICGGIALFSVIGFYFSYMDNKETGRITNIPYKSYYTVYRPDDPRIATLKEEWFKNGAPPMTTSSMDKRIEN